MFTALLDQLGEWNPQLFRELKGRVNERSIGIALCWSALIQCILVGVSSVEKCALMVDGYCQEYHRVIQWQFLFMTLSFMLPLLLFAGGVYLLIRDLMKERRRGTLNFIRLSPRSSQNILLGKLLGVPVLLYGGVGLAIPLHWVCAIATGVPLGWVFGFYALIAAVTAGFYTISLLNALQEQISGPYPAMIGSGLAAWFGVRFVWFILFDFPWEQSPGYRNRLNWFFWRDLNLHYPLGFTLVFLAVMVANYWIWQALNRRFTLPNGPVLPKGKSYGLVASFHLWMLGFCYPFGDEIAQTETLMPMMFGISLLTGMMFLVMIPAISPQRQTLWDWARYAHEQRRPGLNRPYSRWQDWIWGENSPTGVAIAINLGIVAAIWIPWIFLSQGSFDAGLQAGLALLMTLNLIWIYSAIAQCFSWIQFPKPRLVLLAMLLVTLALPPLLFSLVFETVSVNTTLWMLFVFGSPWFALPEASIMATVLSFLGQVAAIATLTRTLNHQIHQAGASDSQLLFADHSPQIPPQL